MRTGAALLAVAACLTTAASSTAQARMALDVDGGAPRVIVGSVLDEPALEDAVRSGLPLRMRFRVELWRDRWSDDLIEQAAFSAVLAFEPLEARFLAAGTDADSIGRFDRYVDARAALERVHSPSLRPTAAGSYYYIAYLEIETLSLSDLEELERWLRGDLEPAVRGGRSVPGAIGTGLKRLLVRVLGLPARRYVVRSDPFRVP